jgi:hypothetical protein
VGWVLLRRAQFAPLRTRREGWHGGVFPSTAEQLQPCPDHVFDRRRDCLLLFYERVAILIGNVKRRPACVLAANDLA